MEKVNNTGKLRPKAEKQDGRKYEGRKEHLCLKNESTALGSTILRVNVVKIVELLVRECAKQTQRRKVGLICCLSSLWW